MTKIEAQVPDYLARQALAVAQREHAGHPRHDHVGRLLHFVQNQNLW